MPNLIQSVKQHAQSKGIENFITILEHIDINASEVVKTCGATSYWNNAIYEKCFNDLWHKCLSADLINVMDTHCGLNADQLATTYLSNHDHSHVTWHSGANNNSGSLSFAKVQPWLMALFTIPGSPLIQGGTEFGQDFWIPEDDQGTSRRIRFRPLQWSMLADRIGSTLYQQHQALINIRKSESALRSDNIYPNNSGNTKYEPIGLFNNKGYGIDSHRKIAIYSRWNATTRFIVVLNFSDNNQWLDIPFGENGMWMDLWNGNMVNVQNYQLKDYMVNSNWGCIFKQ